MKCSRLLALLALLAMLAGCAGTPDTGQQVPDEPGEKQQEQLPDPGDAPDAEQPGLPETLTLAWDPEDPVNPYLAETSVNRQLGGLLYEGLCAATPDGEAECVLCVRYEVSADGRTYTFYLRSGVKMHDGAALTVEDVTASLQAARTSARYRYRLRHISSVLSLEDGSVTVQLDTPCERLPLLLDVPVLRAAEVGEAVPSGTGLYRLQKGALHRFTGAWRTVSEDFGETIGLFRAVTPTELEEAFSDGSVGLVCIDPNGASGPVYHTGGSLYVRRMNTIQYLGFQMKSGPFQSAALRSAVSAIIDRDTISAELGGGFTQGAALPANPAGADYDRGLSLKYGYDEQAFGDALEEAGIRDLDGDGALDVPVDDATVRAEGTLLVCSAYPQRVSAARLIADALKQHGILVSVNAVPWNEYRSALQMGNYDLYYGETELSPDGDLSAFFDPAAELCLPGMANDAALLLCDAALENAGNFYTLYDYVMREGLLCPVLFKQRAVYVRQTLELPLQPSAGNLFYLPVETEDGQ